MYISPRALDGSRRHRLAVGTMLFLFTLGVGAVLTAVGVRGTGGDLLASAGLGAGAVSGYLLAWWSARYWYAAFCEGRRPEPVPQPDAWPWLLPPMVVAVAAAVTGVRALNRGDSGGWFSIGFAALFGLPAVMGLALVLSTRLPGRGEDSAASVQATEPPRPRRDWGPIG
ncbi:hypothetical protein [Streptomyces sp. 8N616]|uniref:hypothetical protein n=1 Tax=Streptomyces sp. 8N616 TaxID=3457414 RepID=UPI003FCF5B56